MLPVILLGGALILILALRGGDGAKTPSAVVPSPPALPPRPPAPPVPAPKPPLGPEFGPALPPGGVCTDADIKFVRDTITALEKTTATMTMLRKGADTAQRCGLAAEAVRLQTAVERGIIPTPTGTAQRRHLSKDDFKCSAPPGKAFACRPRTNTAKRIFRTLQRVINAAAVKVNAPHIKVTVDGRIGSQTISGVGVLWSKFKLPFDFPMSPERISLDAMKILSALRDATKRWPRTASAPVASAGAESRLEAPIPGVTSEQWATFVKSLATGDGGVVTDRGQAGVFGIGARRLEQLGLMEDVELKEGDDGRFYWGSWVSPLSTKRFLRNPELQYRIFCKDIAERYKNIKGGLVGYPINGIELTLSGLLGLLKSAGKKGASAWLSNPADRSRYPNTTRAFIRTNGIF